MTEPDRKCPLLVPDLGRLSVNPFTTWDEDFDRVHAQILITNLQPDYPGAKFYHQAFCSAMTSYFVAFASGVPLATDRGGPTPAAFDYLYLHFQESGMLDDKFTRFSCGIQESARAFFVRACKEANAIRSKVRTELKSLPVSIGYSRFKRLKEIFQTPEANWTKYDRAFMIELIVYHDADRMPEPQTSKSIYAFVFHFVHPPIRGTVAFYNLMIQEDKNLIWFLSHASAETAIRSFKFSGNVMSIEAGSLLSDAEINEVLFRAYVQTPRLQKFIGSDLAYSTPQTVRDPAFIKQCRFYFDLSMLERAVVANANVYSSIPEEFKLNPLYCGISFYQMTGRTPTANDYEPHIRLALAYLRVRPKDISTFVEREDVAFVIAAIRANPNVFEALAKAEYENEPITDTGSYLTDDGYICIWEDWRAIVLAFVVANPHNIQSPLLDKEYAKSKYFVMTVVHVEPKVNKHLKQGEYSAEDWMHIQTATSEGEAEAERKKAREAARAIELAQQQ